MKIRQNFVANSSSSSFLIQSENSLDDVYVTVKIPLSQMVEEYESILSIEQLQEYILDTYSYYFHFARVYFEEDSGQFKYQIRNQFELNSYSYKLMNVDRSSITQEFIAEMFEKTEKKRFNEILDLYKQFSENINQGKKFYIIEVDYHKGYIKYFEEATSGQSNIVNELELQKVKILDDEFSL